MKSKEYQIQFNGWDNPQNIDLSGYHPDYYIDQTTFKTFQQAKLAISKITPDKYDITPNFLIISTKQM